MADDVTLPGAGAVIATDDVSGRQFQIVKLDLGADGQSAPVIGAIPTVENALFLTGAAAQTATVNNILTDPSGSAALEVTNYRTCSVQVVSTGTAGTFIFEQSNDNVNFVALPVFNAALVTGVPVTAAITASASSIIYTFPIRARYVRLRIATTITGGSIRAHTRLSTEPWTAAAQLVASNTAANMAVTVGAALAGGTNAIGDVGVQYRTTATGAATIANVNCPATVVVQTVKGSAGRLLAVTLSNTSASSRWLKVWNTAAGSITLGTTAALFEVGLPAGQTIHFQLEGGYAMGTAINIAITGGQGLTNNTAVTLGDVTGVIGFA
jgi:hypothetical protein